MKHFLLISLFTPFILFCENFNYEIGSELESRRNASITLLHYRSDAIKLGIARDFSFSSMEFMRFGTVDVRDIYKSRRGDVIRLKESIQKGKIYKVELLNNKVKRKNYFVLTEDLKRLSLVPQESS
jgi:hypothetical protein